MLRFAKLALLIAVLATLCGCTELNIPSSTAGFDASTGPESTVAPPWDGQITQTANCVVLENDSMRISLSRDDASVVEFLQKDGNADILAESTYFASLEMTDGSWSFPQGLAWENESLVVDFDNGMQVLFRLEISAYGFTIELLTSLNENIQRILFCDMTITAPCTDDPDSWRLSGLAMNTNTDPWYYPGGDEKAVLAMVFPANGDTKGAKLGVAFTTFAVHRLALKRICDQIDPSAGLVCTNSGAYAADRPDVYADNVISDSVSPETAPQLGKLARLYNIGCISFHQGYGTFTQGSFDFPCVLTDGQREQGMRGTAAMFKSLISDPLALEGIKTGLHTYSSLIDRDATAILTDPEWQQQICVVDQYTLAEGVGVYDEYLPTQEDASGFVRQEIELPYNDIHTAYLLIDSEIVLAVQNDKTGFVEVVRGQLGTEPAPHSAGVQIRQLGGMYNMFQSEPGSELFYKVAQWTADTFNDGGFTYIYLDGLESMSYFCPEDRYWYYLAEFVHGVIQGCDRMPVMDYNCMMPSVWNGRAREGATDTPYHGYQEFIKDHLAYNLIQQRDLLTGTLGWMSFCPDGYAAYKNCVVKTLFRDDIDLLGTYAIAYDQSMTYLDFDLDALDGTTRQAENYAYYSLYSKLRQVGYFADAVKMLLQRSEYALKLENTDHGYGFRQMHYESNKIYNQDDAAATGNNPFGSQAPYIRIEGRYSATGEGKTVLLELDETADIADLQGEHTFEVTDLSHKNAFIVRVFGNGQADAAVILSIRSEVTVEAARLDYVVPLNHTGWKEFVLIDADNGEYGNYDVESILLPEGMIDYETYRGIVEMDKVNSVTLTLVNNCEGARIDDVYTCSVSDAAVKNPSLTVNGQTITFEAEVCGGAYIEYDPVADVAYLYYYEGDTALSKQIPVRGQLIIHGGEFSYQYVTTALTDAPVRAKVVIGFAGNLIENP